MKNFGMRVFSVILIIVGIFILEPTAGILKNILGGTLIGVAGFIIGRTD